MTQIIEPEEVFSPEEIKRLVMWIKRYENPLFFLLHSNAEQVFREFDKLYFQRTGISETEYLCHLVNEVRQQASLAFTEMPNGANETMFHYSEAQRPEAYKAFEARLIARCAKEECRLRFKAYIARRYGLRVPLKPQQA
jgi:hypothetical protein